MTKGTTKAKAKGKKAPVTGAALQKKKGKALSREERNTLLLEQLPQVRYIARRIHDRLPQHVSVDDLIHAGILGLMDAIEKYDPGKNVQFKSYAKFRIRGSILDSLRELDWSPRELRKRARQIEEAHRNIRAAKNRPATEPEVADVLEMSLEDYQQLLGEIRGLDLGSLQAEAGETGREDEVVTALPAPPELDPFALTVRAETKHLLAQAVRDLNEKERQVLALYYFEELTMKEVGAVLGVGESRVSQIHSAALIRVRARLRDLSAQPGLSVEELLP